MALGTGAVSSVTSSNSDSSFRVVAPGADITITGPASSSGDVIVDPSDSSAIGTDGIRFGELEFADLPLVYVNDVDGMVEIQVAAELGVNHGNVGQVCTVTNNSSSTDYDVGFTYTGYGDTVTNGPSAVDASVAQKTFQLVDGSDSTQYSPTGGGSTPSTRFTLSGSGSSKNIDLSINASHSELVDNLANDGTFDQDQSGTGFSSTSYSLIEEVTADATESA
ncbi:hypothetical protein [Halobaculum sp. EA56]|uniref:hypothetical protein n=1 Tax=Halobaculum sp. EA56 TaxID=3421648 RepID=UPI003EBED7B8